MLMFPCAYNYKVEYRPGVLHSNADVSLCIQLLSGAQTWSTTL